MTTLTSMLRGAPRTSALRFALGVGLVLAWTAALVLFAQHGPQPWAPLVSGVLVTVPLVSMWEWLVHGVLYHGGLPGMAEIRAIHVVGHHGALFPPKRYVHDGQYAFMRFRGPRLPWRMSDNRIDEQLTSWAQVALHFVTGIFAFVLPLWWLSGSSTFVASGVATLALLSWLLAYVHGCIHTPGDRAIEHMRWFQWLDRHHYIHHIDGRSNINFLLPLCDVLFGTWKRQLTEREAAAHPTFEEAKPMAKDIGRLSPELPA